MATGGFFPMRVEPGAANGARPYLSAREARAATEVIRRVRRHVPAELVQALLFGSKARLTARPDSDVDLLLIFRALPPDREPQASIAEELAEEVAHEERVPVAPWSVSLADLELGMRTPMLVDALADGVPLWPEHSCSPRLHFTPADALRCTGALLQRVEEGSEEVAAHRAAGDLAAAAQRARDDVVRLCTAGLLLHGETRPRRAAAVRRFREACAAADPLGPEDEEVLRWAVASFGPDGTDEERPVPPPPCGFRAAAATVDVLRRWVAWRRARLERALATNGNPERTPGYDHHAA